jgi:hypothetical protein
MEDSNRVQVCKDLTENLDLIHVALNMDETRDKLVCHRGEARPQVADGGTACNMDYSCEYIE